MQFMAAACGGGWTLLCACMRSASGAYLHDRQRGLVPVGHVCRREVNLVHHLALLGKDGHFSLQRNMPSPCQVGGKWWEGHMQQGVRAIGSTGRMWMHPAKTGEAGVEWQSKCM